MKEKRLTVKQKIASLLAKFTPLHEEDITDAIDATPGSVHFSLHDLKREGKVGKSKSTQGYWYSKVEEKNKES